MNPLTQQAVAQLKAGNKVEAQRLLEKALAQDTNDLQSWLWLSVAVDSAEDKTECLQMVLKLDPNNQTARRGLAAIAGQAKSTPPAPQYSSSVFTGGEPPRPPETGSNWQPGPAVSRTSSFTSEPAPAHEPVSPVESFSSYRTPERERPEPLGAIPKSPKAARVEDQGGIKSWMWAVLIGLVVLLIVTVAGIAVVFNNRRVQAAAALTASAPIPATRTPAPTRAPTATETLQPSRTPTPIPTLNPTIISQMAGIQKQVAGLRGLPIKASVPSFMLTTKQAEELLRSLYITSATRASLNDEKRTLVIFGLIRPSYDLVNMALNSYVDNLGGFYLSDLKRLYILTSQRFGGVERFIFSHEFDHAIVDQTYDIAKLKTCPNDSDRCEAIDALIEGDATYLMTQWLRQYVTAQDISDIQSYIPPSMAIAEANTPPYVEKEMDFAYDEGLKFVTVLFQRGGWAAVNQGYANPPASTEQILHPEKYFANEKPATVPVPVLDTVLGKDWRLTGSDTIGEWSTYLMLGYGTDETARLDDKVAATAAAGWGGDHYQVYYNEQLDKSALAAYWAWDTDKDAVEFKEGLKKILAKRYKNSVTAPSGADCWEYVGQTTCLLNKSKLTLWLSAPDMATVEKMRAQYPEFK